MQPPLVRVQKLGTSLVCYIRLHSFEAYRHPPRGLLFRHSSSLLCRRRSPVRPSLSQYPLCTQGATTIALFNPLSHLSLRTDRSGVSFILMPWRVS